ncbi:Ig-like domain repeat protein [Aeromicrobium fastidiosum]|uniref:Uncharacterized protein n=1 Tax=Aeromicrobium fastidiosum TaxID=52699 RepID=A0A641AQK6_9ACTN|nr:Ig-like domain repeat protein [Aeromicrobium fastidiosum]KAA1380225.1 hypothetical protein ESP62_003245 [Aeromicrobium fastidiosum]MBP2389775.1 hypothetical protein [Aeromicrobium fastidiosum]
MKITPLRRTGALVATLALAAGTLAATAVTASAAGTAGIVTGTVSQPGGGALARTSITFFAENGPGSADNVSRSFEVNEDGTFAAAVPAGSYVAQVYDNCQVFDDFATPITVAGGVEQAFNPQFTAAEATAPTALCARVQPKVAGLPQVGVPLTVSSGTYAQPVSSISYQWYSGSAAIAGASGTTYVPTADDVGSDIYVEVTVASSLPTKIFRASPTEAIVRRGDYVFRTGPKVNGLPVVGRTIAASPGALVPGASVSYQWFRNGAALPGKTARTYRVAKADYKKKITAVVTYKTLGYSTVARTVAPAFVPKNKGKISARTSVSKKTATIKVAVSPKASRKSQGKIIVLEDGKTLKRASIKAGTTTVKVTGLKKGKHKLTIVFDGKKNLAGTSKTVRIKK